MFILRGKSRHIADVFGAMTLPPQIDSEISAPIVERLLANVATRSDINQLYNGHIRLAIHIAGRYAYRSPHKIYDMIGEAMIAIGVAIKKASSQMRNENFTAFCSSRIHSRIRKFLYDDKEIRIPESTVSDRENRGLETHIPEVEEFDSRIFRRFHARQTRRHQKQQERVRDLKDMIAIAAKTESDKQIMELRLIGYTDREIGEKLGLSTSKVNHARKEIGNTIQRLDNSAS